MEETCRLHFQFYNLVSNLTAKENVELAAEIKDAQDERALKAVGLGHRINNFPAQPLVGNNDGLPHRTWLLKIQNSYFFAFEPPECFDYHVVKTSASDLRYVT